MGYKCIICNKEYIKHNGISFHTFPREYSLRKAWRKACKLQHHRVLKRARICSQHFTKDSFLPNKDYKRESMRLLKPSAVPEVFPWNLKNNLIATIDLTSQTRLESLESIEYIVTSTSKQNQDDEDCAYTNAFSSSELTIPCNNLSRTSSPENIKKCNLSRTPSNKVKTETDLCEDTEVKENSCTDPLDEVSNRKQTMQADDFRTQGFRRGLEADKILGSADDNGELMYLIQWKGTDAVDMVSAKEANAKCPQIVIRFYEDRITWNKAKISA